MTQSDTSRAADVLSRLTDLTQVGTLVWRPATALPRPLPDPLEVAVVGRFSRTSESDYEATMGDDRLHLTTWESYDSLSPSLGLAASMYVGGSMIRRSQPTPTHIDLWVKEPSRLNWARLAEPQSSSALRPFLVDLWRAVVGGAEDVVSTGFMDRVLRSGSGS